MQTLSQSYSIVAVGTSLYGTLIVDHELVVDPNLLHAGREIVNTILRNIDESLSNRTIVVGTTQGCSIVWLAHLHLVQVGNSTAVLPLSISKIQLVYLQIITLDTAQLQACLGIAYIHSRSIVLLLYIDGSHLAHLSRRQYGSNLDGHVAAHLDRLGIDSRSWSWSSTIQGIDHLHRT